jgi:hypothetical protein
VVISSSHPLGVRCRVVALVTAILVLHVSYARAQVSRVGASLEGTVSDSSSAVIFGAKVTVRNTLTNQSRIVMSDDQGFFRGRSTRCWLSLPKMLSGANAFEISDIEWMNIGGASAERLARNNVICPVVTRNNKFARDRYAESACEMSNADKVTGGCSLSPQSARQTTTPSPFSNRA